MWDVDRAEERAIEGMKPREKVGERESGVCTLQRGEGKEGGRGGGIKG